MSNMQTNTDTDSTNEPEQISEAELFHLTARDTILSGISKAFSNYIQVRETTEAEIEEAEDKAAAQLSIAEHRLIEIAAVVKGFGLTYVDILDHLQAGLPNGENLYSTPFDHIFTKKERSR